MKVQFLSLSLLLTAGGLAAAPSITTDSPASAALHLDWLDKSISPEKDFFAFANGNWQKQNPIPHEYSSWGTFYILDEEVRKKVHQLLMAAAQDKKAKPGSITQKIGDFYYSGMDEASIEKWGISPLNPEFAKIADMKTLADLQNLITHFHKIGVSACFDFSSMQDFANSEEVIGAAEQGGLGLPDRDYYLQDTEKFKKIRDTYRQHIAKMFELIGDAPALAKQEASVVMSMETELAKASMSKVEQRDPHAIYNMKNIEALEKITPHFSWPHYFKSMHLTHIEQINVGMPNFFKKLDNMFAEVPLENWKIYLRWHLIDSFAPYLSTPFVEQNFKMSSAISGTKKILPRWQRVVGTANGALGFAIGEKYVEKYFPPDSKQAVLEIVNNIRKVLEEDLKTLSWMTPATREAALKKLAMMKERVGYPDKWWDYSSLKVDRGPYVLNVIHANRFLVKRDLNKIGKPLDRTEWAMPPQTVNAYYDPSMNNINLPAGILQPPFFDPKAPAAINYGGIGYVIGHEMTHGFDDQGAQFDGYGNLKNWWTPEDLKKFKAATQCIMEQYSQYKVADDLHLQGKLVMGEATADLGGVILAYRAFHQSMDFKNAPIIDGYTPDQQFFLGLAHVEAANIRPEQLRHLATTDPHPPMSYRVNGTLANLIEFQKAFAIPEKSAMRNVKRCVIW